LKVTTETTATRQVMLTIEPDPGTIQGGLRRAARNVSRLHPVAGFRPGKAPYAMVEQIYGREMLLNEALREIAPQIYSEAIEESGVEPFEQGQLEVESQDPVILKVDLPLVPKVELGDYESLHIAPEPEIAITQEQIDQELQRVQKRHAEYEPVERPIESGDQVVASIKGTSDGELVVDQESATLDVTDDMMPPGFSEALVGMQKDESREFALTYPDGFDNEDLAGRQVDFSVSS